MSEPKRYDVFGPSRGSTHVALRRSQHGRIVLDVVNDFSQTRGVLDDEGARALRHALTELLGDGAA